MYRTVDVDYFRRLNYRQILNCIQILAIGTFWQLENHKDGFFCTEMFCHILFSKPNFGPNINALVGPAYLKLFYQNKFIVGFPAQITILSDFQN